MEYKKFKGLLKSLSDEDMVCIISCEKRDDNYIVINCQSGTHIKVQLPCTIPEPIHNWLRMTDIKKIFNLLKDYPREIKIKENKISIDGYIVDILPDNGPPVIFKMPERADNYVSGYDYSILKPYMFTKDDYRYTDIGQVLFSDEYVYSTDSKRMIRVRIKSDVKQDFTIPENIAKNLPCEFGVDIDDDNNITLVIYNVRIQFYNNVASYPGVKNVIESLGYEHTITVKTKDMLENVNKVKKLKEKHINIFSDIKNELIIKTYKPENGIEYEKNITGDVHDPIDMAFTTTYLYALLNTFKKEREVIIKYADKWKPVYIETDDKLAILAPIRKL